MSKETTIANTAELPSDYQLYTQLDLNKNKKINRSIQSLMLLITGIMSGMAIWLDFPMASSWNTGISILFTVLVSVSYMVIHEWTHGIFLRFFSGRKSTFSIRFPFLITGSETFLNKKSFIVVALAPVFIWGILLIPPLLLLPTPFFFSIYIVLILNFAGSAGDYIQAYLISKLPRAALIQDNGKETTIFLPANKIKTLT